MAALWQTVLFALGLAVFLLISAYVFYITSDGYRLRKKRRELGYETAEWSDILFLLFILCLGPINRSRWERKHKFFRTEDYGPMEKDWKKVKPATAPGQEWQKLPRGDVDHAVKIVSKAVAKCEVNLLNDLFEDALDAVLIELLKSGTDLAPKVRRVSDYYLAKTDAEHQAIAESHEQRLAAWEAQAAAEVQASMMATTLPTVSLAALAEQVDKKSEAHIRGIDLPLVPGSSRLDGFSHKLSLRELCEVVNKMGPKSLQQEFRGLPLNLPIEEEADLAYLEFERDPRILPTRHTHVKLEPLPGIKTPYGDFIHANLVRGPNNNPLRFIATQSPMDGTEKGTMNTQMAFWQMVWQYQACGVVSLVLPTQERCPRYWPNPEEKVAHFGPFKVECVQADVKNNYTLHVLQLTKAGDSHDHIFLHFTFPGWPYQSVPSSYSALQELVKELNSLMSRFPEPLVVHDDRGFGPTGVFLAMFHGLYQLETTNSVDILKIVATLREDRAALVETLVEYQFLHRVLATMTSTASSIRAPPPAYTNAPPYYAAEGSKITSSAPPAPITDMLSESAAARTAAYDKAMDNSLLSEPSTLNPRTSEDYMVFNNESIQRRNPALPPLSPIPPLIHGAEMRQRSSTVLPNLGSSQSSLLPVAAGKEGGSGGATPKGSLKVKRSVSPGGSRGSMKLPTPPPVLGNDTPKAKGYDPTALGSASPLPSGGAGAGAAASSNRVSHLEEGETEGEITMTDL